MKKIIFRMGIISFAFLMSFGMYLTPASATSASTQEIDTSKYSPQATRNVSKVVRYDWKETVPNTYEYNEAGYYGILNLDYIFYDNNNKIKIATYKGTATCEGNCPIPPTLSIE